MIHLRSSAVALGCFAWSLIVGCTTQADAAEDRVRFNRDVRPILSDRCFHCHGPDSSKRAAELRLDDRDAAVSRKAISPESPETSEMIRRVLSDDPDEVMPPPASKLDRLSANEVGILKRWIAQGAEYESHWAFLPVGEFPANRPFATDLIDEPIARELTQRGLARQPAADRATLIRRLSFDLVGLPPSPADVEAFLSDASPDAYERLVDRLLASEHYGERMAVDWLDVSRYSDSFGFQVDREREMWPWRDWVIAAFNRNVPFDQFVTWQVAGDLLPDASDEQILATAFNRLHQQESEGGSVEEEYRVEYVCDRVQTFATAFLGLTFECARCHDHKYDPVKQREYYQLFAMFQNIDEAGLYSFFTPSPPTPTLLLSDVAAKAKLAELAAAVAQQERQSAEVRESRRPSFSEWLTRQAAATDPAVRVKSLGEKELGRFPFDELVQGTLANLLDEKAPAKLHGENRLAPGKFGQAIQFTGDDPVHLTIGNFHRYDPFSVSLWLKTPDVKDRAVVFHRSQAWTDAASRGYELLIEDGRLKWSLIHFWPGNAASIRASAPVPLDEWTHVVVTSDGSSRAAGLRLYVNGQPAAVDVVKDNLSKDIPGGGHDHISLGERMRDRGFKNGLIDDFRVFQRELAPLEAHAAFDLPAVEALLARDPAALSPVDREQLFHFYLAAADEPWSRHLESLRAARAAHSLAVEGVREIMVMRELPQPKPAFVLFRGEYAERREQVQPGVPAALNPFPAEAPANRLGLARWLTDRQHPLLSRVTVNRIWQSIFGRGLVKTSEDFGSQGSRPLYPDVLDGLSARFIETGWNVKQLLKTIVMSDTYRQRSVSDTKTMADDPDNEWLARGPRFRLSAEMIRDNALAASGLLKPRLGGPPVNPFELSEAFRPAAASGGDGPYRRSLYTNWRRTAPPPAMLAFDAPRRAVCIAKRERTDSPLQALILLNGVQYVEAARVLGESLHAEAGGNVDGMIQRGVVRCLSRVPDARELDILKRLYQEQRDYYAQHAAEAEDLLKIGPTPRDARIPPPDAAAAMALAQALLNHDACVVKR